MNISKQNCWIWNTELQELLKAYGVPGGTTIAKGDNQYTPRAMGVLSDSHNQAAFFHGGRTGTEHILIALLRDGDNMAGKMLSILKVNVKKVYMDVILAMGEGANAVKEKLSRRNMNKKKNGADKSLHRRKHGSQIPSITGWAYQERHKQAYHNYSRNRTAYSPCSLLIVGNIIALHSLRVNLFLL